MPLFRKEVFKSFILFYFLGKIAPFCKKHLCGRACYQNVTHIKYKKKPREK